MQDEVEMEEAMRSLPMSDALRFVSDRALTSRGAMNGLLHMLSKARHPSVVARILTALENMLDAGVRSAPCVCFCPALDCCAAFVVVIVVVVIAVCSCLWQHEYQGDWETWFIRILEILEAGATLHFLVQRAALMLLRKVRNRRVVPVASASWPTWAARRVVVYSGGSQAAAPRQVAR
jgi:hypothetical protein